MGAGTSVLNVLPLSADVESIRAEPAVTRSLRSAQATYAAPFWSTAMVGSLPL
jgi:hypothetical protein